MLKFFDAETCLDIIRDKLEENETIWGYQQKLADAAGCQASYLSKVLKGTALLTADQASSLADFWELDEDHWEFFLALVDLQKATSLSYINKLQSRIETLRTKGRKLRPAEEAVPKVEVNLSEDDLKFFCQYWYCPAIRNILRFPEYRSIHLIAKRFELPKDVVGNTLRRLLSMGLVAEQNGEWTTTDIMVSRPSYHYANMAFNSKLERARFRNSTGLENNLTIAWMAPMSRRRFEDLKVMLRDSIVSQITAAEKDRNEEVLVGNCCELFLL